MSADDGAAPLSERALERRLKRHLRKETLSFFAVGAPGFEAELAAEVAALPGAAEAAPTTGGVAFRGPLDTVYHATLQLRTAHRLLLRLREGFLAQSRPMLFDHARRVPWELHLGFAEGYALSTRGRESRLEPGDELAGTVADAVRAHLEPLGLAPELRNDAPLPFQLRLYRDRGTLSFDTSGRHLHRRGYRTHVTEAPLRETLAAAALLAAGAREADLIVDPFCGSGTLPIEAALLLAGAPPGALAGFRPDADAGSEDAGSDLALAGFAFQFAPWHLQSKWERLRREAVDAIRPIDARIVASDIDGDAVAVAERNAERAGAEGAITFGAADAFELPLTELRGDAERPLLVANPPYGRRLGSDASSKRLAAALGAKLRVEGASWRYAVITAHPDALTAGLEREPERTVRFRNGGVGVTLAIGRVG